MSKHYNKLIFVGHLSAAPEMRYTPSGQAVTSFSVASNDQYTNNKGETVKTTTWFRCTAWEGLAEVCNQYLKKGSKVLVEGRLAPDKTTGSPRIWTDPSGAARASFEVKIREIYFLDSKNGSGQEVQTDPASTGPEEDLPF